MGCSVSCSNDCPDRMNGSLDQISPAIDRVSPVPLYFQVEQALAAQIREGSIPLGSRLPTEPELSDHFGVSRSVIRQAFRRLEEMGLVARRRGVGSFVVQKDPPSWQLQGSRGFFEDEVARLGREVVSSVLRAEVVPLPDWAAALLELDEGALGVVLERLRYVDGLLTVYDLNYLPERFADAVVSLRSAPHGSLYETLRRAHETTVLGGRRTIDAIVAGPEFAQVLEVDENAPLLLVEAVDLDGAQRPFDCYRTWLRPDRLKIRVDVLPGAPALPSPLGEAHFVSEQGGAT
jgi:GntR family transcriptional regulator